MSLDDEVSLGSRLLALVFLDGVPPWARIALPLAVIAVAGACGALALELQHSLLARENSGADLGSLARLFAHGSTWITALCGWIAAACIGAAARPLGAAAPEPPAMRRPEQASVAGMRRALRREYLLVRIALVVVGFIALYDLARALRDSLAALARDQVVRDALAATWFEAAGLVVAALALAWWALGFRSQLEQVGAV